MLSAFALLLLFLPDLNAQPPNLIIRPEPQTICLGSSVQLDVDVSGSPGPFTYTWTSVPIGFTSAIKNPLVDPGPSVTTTYNVAVFDGVNTANASVVITVVSKLVSRLDEMPNF